MESLISERDHDVMLDLRKSIDDLVDQIKDLNAKLPKSYEIDNLVKSIHKLAQCADGK